MRSSPLCFMARTKFSPSLRRTASVKAWADSLSKPQPHFRSWFTSRFFGWRAVGINNPARKEFSIPFSRASAWAQAQLRSSCFFKKAVRSLRFQLFWLAAQPSWPSQEFCFFMSHHRGSACLALRSRSSGCFCFGAKITANANSEVFCAGITCLADVVLGLGSS